jgi:hypothetical protein
MVQVLDSQGKEVGKTAGRMVGRMVGRTVGRTVGRMAVQLVLLNQTLQRNCHLHRKVFLN